MYTQPRERRRSWVARWLLPRIGFAAAAVLIVIVINFVGLVYLLPNRPQDIYAPAIERPSIYEGLGLDPEDSTLEMFFKYAWNCITLNLGESFFYGD